MQTDPSIATPDVLAHVAVFPLPQTVLFPGVVLPLHIFEPRYRTMLDDVMAGSQLMVITQASPDLQQLAQVGCLARVVQVQRQPDGRANILLRGEERVRLLDEAPGPASYRRFGVQRLPRPKDAPTAARPQALSVLQHFLWHLGSAAARRDKQLAEVMRATDDPVTLADFLAASLVRDVSRQQAVLESRDMVGQIGPLVDGLAEALLKLTGDELAAGANN